MAFNLGTIRANLKTELAEITGWETYAYWTDSPVPPCGLVVPGDGVYHDAMQGGLGTFPFDLVLLVSSVVTDEAQALLDEFLSSGTDQAKSIIDKLQGSNLSGACSQVHVIGWGNYGAVELPNETRLFGAVVNTQITCNRK